MVEDHGVLLRGASFLAGGRLDAGAPAILQRTDDDPVGVLLERLASENGRGELAGSLAGDRDQDGNLDLYQPVHRTWHLALLEIACEAPGLPRLDPQRIESAGLVIRRLGPNGILEGWRRAGRKLRGWLPFGPGEDRLDPDPKQRRAALRSGHPEIDRLLALRGPLGSTEPLEEAVSPLFPAPPEVCKAAGKTLLYGLVPLTSAERSEIPAMSATLADLEDQEFARMAQEQIPLLLKSDKAQTYSWNRRGLKPGSRAGVDGLATDFEHLDATLQYLHLQIDAFDGGPAGRRVLDILDEVPLKIGNTVRKAGKLLAEAAEVLLFQMPGAKEVQMPDVWPLIPKSVQTRLAEAATAAMRDRLAALSSGEGRFDPPGRRYVLEAFARVRSHHPECPSKLVWSTRRSVPFRIVPWYEAGALPPTQVALPDFTDRRSLRKLKPNVAFILPKKLKDIVDGNSGLDDLIKGKLKGGAGAPGGSDDSGDSDGSGGGGGFKLAWICGFNIPLITLCAFFVLSIFLSLLNIIFWWLPFIKICIPFPRKK